MENNGYNKTISIIVKAAQFANDCHAGQFRKYNGRPYITHPIRVAGRVATHPMATEELVAAAFLHDVVEDCGVKLSTIQIEFGFTVAEYVGYLTNNPKLPGVNRKERKHIECERISKIPPECKIVKLIDRIDNLMEIDPSDGFCEVYTEESLQLLTALSGVDRDLEEELATICTGYYE